MKKQPKNISKERELHMTMPPRMEGKVKNAKMNPVRKPKKKK
jgi:hypothetical protein